MLMCFQTLPNVDMVLRPSIDQHSIEVHSIQADFQTFTTLAQLGTIGSIQLEPVTLLHIIRDIGNVAEVF